MQSATLTAEVKPSEQDIVRLLGQRDSRAMGMIYDRYADALYGTLRRMLPDEAATRDVMQEGFVKVWNHADHYDPTKSTLFTWLLRILRNTAIDRLRSDKVRSDHKIQMASSAVSEVSNSFKPEHLDVPELVAGLDPKYQDVIQALFFKGMTQQEASDALEIPLGTVKTRLKIALRELRNVFGEQQLLVLLVVTMLT